MAKFVRASSASVIRMYEQSIAPTTPQGITLGDLWVDTSSTPVVKICTNLSPVAFNDVGSGGGSPSNTTITTRTTDSSTSAEGAAVYLADMEMDIEANGEYLLEGFIVADIGNVLTSLTIGVTDDPLLNNSSTLTCLSGIFSAHATGAIVAAKYTTQTYGLSTGNLVVGSTGNNMFKIELLFTAGAVPGALSFWIASTEVETSKLKAGTSIRLTKLN